MPVEHDMQMTDAEHLREYARQLVRVISDRPAAANGRDLVALNAEAAKLETMIYDLSRSHGGAV